MALSPLLLKLSDYSLSISLSFLSLGIAGILVYWAVHQISCLLNPLRKLPFPPGPPPRDFISGNAADLSRGHLWFTLTDWAAKYGGIIQFKAFSSRVIVLSSIDHAVEILDKRSNNYSDRPYIPMINLVGWTFATGFKPYGPDWHAHRCLMQQMFKPASSLEYRSIQTEKVNDFLNHLLDTPHDFLKHIGILSVTIIMSTVYGYEDSSKIDEFQILAKKVADALNRSSFPGDAFVNVLPFLRFIPAWFPGAYFQRFAQESRAFARRMQDIPYRYVQASLADGTASPSIVSAILDSCKSEEDHLTLKEFAATGYVAGTDTTTSALETFFYAMTLHPEIQKKAQEELDRVVGNDRLPNYGDESLLPYIQAIFREVMRWRPVLPLGVFHASMSDDVYNGYYIPKGTTVVSNIWAMSRDHAKYKDPETFMPERFLDENNRLNNDTLGYVFGFGRRICPGRHLASATTWLTIATVLSTFDIHAPKDTLGNDIPLRDVEYTGGLMSHVHPFKCIVAPRSGKAKQLVVDINNAK